MTRIISTSNPQKQQNSQLLPTFPQHLLFGPHDGEDDTWKMNSRQPQSGVVSLLSTYMRCADSLCGGMYVFEKDQETLEDWPLLSEQEEEEQLEDPTVDDTPVLPLVAHSSNPAAILVVYQAQLQEVAQ